MHDIADHLFTCLGSFQGYVSHLHVKCELEPSIEVWAFTWNFQGSRVSTHCGTVRRIWNKPREYGDLFVERTSTGFHIWDIQ